MPDGILILLGLGAATLLPALVGGVHMLPGGWVFRREEPGKFWGIFLVQLVAILLFVGVAAFAFSRGTSNRPTASAPPRAGR